MKKKLTLTLLFLALCVTLTACSSENATKVEFFPYVVDVDNHVVITGYTGNELSVVIPSKIDGKTVTGIAEKAFEANNLIVKMKIPNTVTYIGKYAFQNCENLQSIELPNGLSTIPAMLFDGCASLSSVSIPNSVTMIDNYAFSGCKSLRTVALPAGLKRMGSGVFSESGLTSITIPSNVRHEETGSTGWFQSCKLLRTVVYEQGNTEIYLKDFWGDADKWAKELYLMSIDSMTIPDSVKEIYAWNGSLLSQGEASFYGIGNCEIKAVHVKKGSYAAAIFEDAKRNDRFVAYQVNEKWYSFIDGKEYRNGGTGVTDTYFKNNAFEGSIIYN